MLVLAAHGLQEIVFLHRINYNLGRCVCPLLTLHFLHIYCCYLDLCRLHVGTHGSCVRSNGLLTANSLTVVGGRTSRVSLHFAPLFRSFFARKGTRICEQRELREALCLLGLRALRARVREDV